MKFREVYQTKKIQHYFEPVKISIAFVSFYCRDLYYFYLSYLTYSSFLDLCKLM